MRWTWRASSLAARPSGHCVRCSPMLSVSRDPNLFESELGRSDRGCLKAQHSMVRSIHSCSPVDVSRLSYLFLSLSFSLSLSFFVRLESPIGDTGDSLI